MTPRHETWTEHEYPTDDGRYAEPWRRKEKPYSTLAHPYVGHQMNDDNQPAWLAAHEEHVNWPARLFQTRPETATQALMETAPHHEPEVSTDEAQPLRELLGAAIDALPPVEREVLEGLVIRRESLSTMARRLAYSRTHVSRIRDTALASLALDLGAHPLILEHLEAQ